MNYESIMHLEVTKLTIGFKSKILLGDLNFSLTTGEVLGLIGVNGVGKSTLLKTLMRKIKPDSGLIKINDKDIYHYKLKDFAKLVNFLEQNLAVSEYLTVKDLVKLGRNPYQKIFQWQLSDFDQNIVQQALELLDLFKVADMPLSKISGGELQRAWLGSVIAQGSRFLLLDEPSNNLDINHQLNLSRILKHIAKQNIGLLVVSHDLNFLSKVTDKVILLNGDNRHSHIFGPTNEVLTQSNLEAVFKLKFKHLGNQDFLLDYRNG